MNVISRYKHWLSKVSEHFSLSEDTILNTRKRNGYVTQARITFYTLCLRDNICLYTLSNTLDKERTTIYTTLKRSRIDVKQHVETILNSLQ